MPFRRLRRLLGRDLNQVALDEFERAGGDDTQPQLITYFLVFPDAAAADRAGADLAEAGFVVNAGYTARFAEDGKEGWLVVEKTGALADLPTTEAELQGIADEHGGVYDGWEAGL